MGDIDKKNVQIEFIEICLKTAELGLDVFCDVWFWWKKMQNCFIWKGVSNTLPID